uniref:TLC domain-containing protein n=1 Tax=Rhabditophanes sp. KR3021 TaxID=114890 RepID=A0AC35TYP7_9BILA
MRVEGRRITHPPRRRIFNPDLFTFDYIVKNHGDLAGVLCLCTVIGLIFDVSLFIFFHYGAGYPKPYIYETGPKDFFNVAFFVAIWIFINCNLSNYFLEKLNRRNHYSKNSCYKFLDSCLLFVFYTYSTIHTLFIIYYEESIWKMTSIYVDQSDKENVMSINIKAYSVIQMAFWFHHIPETLLQGNKCSRAVEKMMHSIGYLILIVGCYFLNYIQVYIVLITLHYIAQSGYHISRIQSYFGRLDRERFCLKCWSYFFPLVTVISFMISVIMLWQGLGKKEVSENIYDEGEYKFSNAVLFLATCLFLFWNESTHETLKEKKALSMRGLLLNKRNKKKEQENGAKTKLISKKEKDNQTNKPQSIPKTKKRTEMQALKRK